MYTLITSATTAQAQKLKNSLQQPNVILGDYRELPAFMLKSAGLLKLPNPASVSYAHEMLTLCLDKQIDTIYALNNEEQKLLKEAEQLFGEFGILVHRS